MRTTTIGKIMEEFPQIKAFDYHNKMAPNYMSLHIILGLFGYQRCKKQYHKFWNSQNFTEMRIQKLPKNYQQELFTITLKTNE